MAPVVRRKVECRSSPCSSRPRRSPPAPRSRRRSDEGPALARRSYEDEWEYFRELLAAADERLTSLDALQRSRLRTHRSTLELHDGIDEEQ
jgi:hypothetical protein